MMSDASSFAEMEAQHVELLPTRTVMSLFSLGSDVGGDSTVVADACSGGVNGNTAGALVCIPAAVVNNHG